MRRRVDLAVGADRDRRCRKRGGEEGRRGRGQGSGGGGWEFGIGKWEVWDWAVGELGSWAVGQLGNWQWQSSVYSIISYS